MVHRSRRCRVLEICESKVNKGKADNMKIFAIMLVKDEADIVKSVILDAKRWADRIFILDNGSTDGTWQVCQSLADDIVVPWKQDFRPYHNGLRADVYNTFREEAQEGDWWCFKLDADEFYVDDPRAFLAAIPRKYDLAAKKSLDYFLTNEDAAEYNYTGDFEADRPFIRYIREGCWSEPRFFREHTSMLMHKRIVWRAVPEEHYPPFAGLLAPKTILVRHYQYRSPAQMQKRLDIRNAKAVKNEGKSFRHVKETDWHELLRPRSALILDDGKIETYNSLPIRGNTKQSFSYRLRCRLCRLI